MSANCRNGTPAQSDFGEDEEAAAARDATHVDQDAQAQSITSSRARQRDADGYAPGEIVRVKLENFVTYDKVEFAPGPHLNMIVGPNGTGKSTIVCAIALGLGYKPSVLGRAKDVASYIKQGKNEGSIEIELKGAFPEQQNPIIRRLLSPDDTSKWQLNGARSTAKEVNSVVDGLGIEIGNLCCFLPQDKVADFAKMDPAELLRETQKAAGHPDMSTWHDELITFGKEQRELSGKIAARDEEAQNLEERVEVLSRDVRRAEERRRIEVRLGALDALLAESEYEAIKTRWNEAREEKKRRSTQLGELKERLKPIRDRLDAVQAGAAQMDDQLKGIKRDAQKDLEICRRSSDQLETMESEADKLTDSLDTVKKQEQTTKNIITQLRREIHALEEEVRIEPPRPNTSQLDARTRRIREEERTLASEDAEVNTEQDEISTEVKTLDRKTDQTRRRLQEIDNVKNARLQMLQRADIDTYKAVMWLREHSGLFQEKVHEPVMLELSVRDQKMASAVEGCINFAGQKTFVCQTEEDYNLFGRKVADQMKLRVNFVHREYARALDEFRRPATAQELEKYGFDGFVIDLVEGPDAVLRYLCTDFHLESVPFARDERGAEAGAVEESGKFQRYITGQNLHTLSRSQYGSRATQTLTRKLRQPRTFIQSIDQSLRHNLDSEINKINERKRELEIRVSALADDATKRRKRADDLRSQRNTLEQEKGAVLKAHGMWERKKVTLNLKKSALQEELKKPSAATETQNLYGKIRRINDKSQKAVLEVKTLLQRQTELRAEGDVLQLQLLQRQAKVAALAQLKEREEGQFQEAQQALEEIGLTVNQLKKEGLGALRKAKAKLEDSDDETRAEFDELRASQMSLVEVQSKHDEEQAKLNLAISVQPGVLEEYSRRRKESESLQSKLTQLQRELNKVNDKIAMLHAKWKPALEELVSSVSTRFSRAFEAIGNAGEVCISEHEQYEKWGIEIQVKFRNEEHMQLLTAQRQSGGERSISTITYLLSLTQMSRSPFSLVDEINQGMDQKYERQVHDHMVRVTCAEMAGQYFLITPKLLPDLTYHDRMRVLIINNGEWLPEQFDFWHYIRAKKTKNTTRAKHPRLDGAASMGVASGIRSSAAVAV